MKALQLIYSFFLGLALAAFAGIGVETFHPRPDFDEPWPTAEATAEQQATFDALYAQFQTELEAWSLSASVIVVIIATVILIIALLLGERLIVLSNGLLLGGLFTLCYGVITSLSADGFLRFGVIALALVVSIVIGWIKFRRPLTPSAPGTVEADADGEASDLATRVAALEHRLDTLRRAMAAD